jgi:phosphatidylinositol-3-phosphatase
MQVRPNPALRVCASTLILILVFILSSCGGGGGTTITAAPPTSGNNSGANGTASSTAHVFVVVLENANYDSVIASKSMPYLNSLIPRGGLATNYFANFHPSIPDYFMLTTGQSVTMTDSFKGVVTDDNIVRELTNAGKTWKVYAQSIPSAGFLGQDVYPYSRHHIPFTYLSDVQQTPTQQANIVPLTQMATDLSSDTLPNYAMIVPDQQNNAHDCPVGFPPGTTKACEFTDRLAAADNFLKTQVAPILANTEFQRSGLLVITFDESAGDDTNGGGKVVTLLLGPRVRVGFQSTTQYAHQSLLRLSLSALGINTFPGQAATAPAMDEFFQ